MRAIEQDTLRDRKREKVRATGTARVNVTSENDLCLEIRRGEICGVISRLHLKEAVPVIMQGDVYCNMSVTLQILVHSLTTISALSALFFFLARRALWQQAQKHSSCAVDCQILSSSGCRKANSR